MRAAEERAFTPVLREIEGGLSLPIPERIRILRELEFDLEELRARFVAEGFPMEEAGRRALEALVPDRASLAELGRLHAPLYRRVTRHLSPERLRKIERWALALATSGVLVAETVALLRTDLFRNPSPFLWPTLGLGALLFASVLAKAFGLWIKGDHAEPRRGLGRILVLAGLTLATGITGMLLDLSRLAGALERDPELAQAIFMEWLIRDMALLTVSILLALAGGLAWLVMTQWLALVGGARRDVLGLGHGLDNNNLEKRS